MISPRAVVSNSAQVADSAQVWDFAQIRDAAEISSGVIVGSGAYIGVGVRVGEYSKIQNGALVYEPAELGRGVFIGPAAVLTNDRNPRAINLDGSQKSASDWKAVGVTVCEGASIGARAVCVAPVRIGKWSMVAAGAVVVRDVPDFAIVAGNPAKQTGWVGRAGFPLTADSPSFYICPKTSERYQEVAGVLTLL